MLISCDHHVIKVKNNRSPPASMRFHTTHPSMDLNWFELPARNFANILEFFDLANAGDDRKRRSRAPSY